ncbi:hypothetical protein KP509_01G126000 [Ceratopteris richardii]|nr:hypothetical protein KP509_01G126000 [Ceratopteris richardii]
MVDDAAQKLAYSVIEGELLNHFKSYRVFLEVAKAEDQNGCVVNWALEYEPVDPNMPPPEISKEGAVGTFKAIEAYLLASSLQG